MRGRPNPLADKMPGRYLHWQQGICVRMLSLPGSGCAYFLQVSLAWGRGGQAREIRLAVRDG
ncbi:hypothetical protein BG454_04265 [Roseinatronobacter bogoriensis subsp. barguzinensis]|uniref:Uncharacterized protein n=1 Tax=Roseinatronobacter bogoriensis subsp. barguzinensis TaxID=441209 RepID=A0A2K8K6Q8_9RHOB|nr:hypothetical protein BG454_04265 [Rhodobaca barguzinensis]